MPLDFFSWHRYANDPSDYARRAKALRQLLDEHGFTKTESHFNEWNYLPNEDWRPMMKEGQGLVREQWSAEMGGPKGAAFAAWALISLQEAPVDAANFYTAEVQMFGMFNLNGVPRKNFYAFKAFRTLLDTPRRVKTHPCEAGHIAVCAGLNHENTRAAILLSNFSAPDGATDIVIRGLPWSAQTGFELYLVDGSHDFQFARRGTLGTDGHLALSELKAPAIALLKLSPLPDQ